MKTKLTEKWRHNMFHHGAMFGHIFLQCMKVSNWGNGHERKTCRPRELWVGVATLGGIHERKLGPNRRSIRAARQDAERLAIELLRDIRDGTKWLMDQYEMGEDD